MKISFRRHGDWDRGTRSLTPQARSAALKKAGEYDGVFSSPVQRCAETARCLSGRDAQVSQVFADFLIHDDIQDRGSSILDFVRRSVGDDGDVLIVTHSNLISALKLFREGGEILGDHNDLPEISNLEGFDIDV